jgi:hypothetical protein
VSGVIARQHAQTACIFLSSAQRDLRHLKRGNALCAPDPDSHHFP